MTRSPAARGLLMVAMAALCTAAGYEVTDDEGEVPASPIQRRGRRLSEDGGAWRAMGFHCPDMAFGPGTSCAQTPHIAQFRRHQKQTVEQALKMGATVLRVGAYQSALTEGLNPYRHLDRLVHYCSNAGLRIIFVLETHDPVCDNVDQVKSLAWYHSGWRDAYGSYRMGLAEHAESLADRYSGEQTVMGYELVAGAPAGKTGVILAHLHGEVARTIKVRAPKALVISGARFGAGHSQQAMDDWLAANRVQLLDAVTADDIDDPYSELPDVLAQAMTGAKMLNRPLFVTAAGIKRGTFSSRERAQRMVNKAATAADLGVTLYTVSSLGSMLPDIEEFGVDVAEPLAQSLPHVAASRFAHVSDCSQDSHCSDSFWADPDPLPSLVPVGPAVPY